MKNPDNAITTKAIEAFRLAWNESTKDYTNRILNSEHTLQAAVYHHLRHSLSDDFKIFTEAVVHLPKDITNTPKNKVVIDLLICHRNTIIAAIELKYAPRSTPGISAVKKDVLSLSRVTNRLRRDDRISIEMPRFLSSEADVLSLSISPLRKLIFAVYCKKNHFGSHHSKFDKSNFWDNFHPAYGYWEKAKSMPKNLGIALALTEKESSSINCHFYGGPFDRLISSENRSPENSQATTK